LSTQLLGVTLSSLFSEFTLNSPRGPLTLSNRAVIAPMCQYSAHDGLANDWHLTHWTNLLNSGASMFIIEATAVTARGRITPQCLGLWDDATAAALDDRLNRARRLAPATPVCIQLAHAGRKASSAVPWEGGQLLDAAHQGWQPEAPSALAHLPNEAAPDEISAQGLKDIQTAFVQAAQRADAMGIDAVELHAAHGYLLHEFLSPLANARTDGYGGNFEGRIRFPLEVFQAVRAVFKGALGMRISASDWVEGGWSPEETADFALRLKAAGADFVHISSAGVSPLQKIAVGPEYQVPFAKLVKQKTGLPTIAVGLITDPHQANDIVARGDADLVALARAFLYKPRWVWEAAAALGGKVNASPQYWRCLPREAQSIFGDVRIGMR
jgi:2,4-dienoyl-CoA reductase-like NADH-dependent reductase (Old Yellow Enzyme family)